METEIQFTRRDVLKILGVATVAAGASAVTLSASEGHEETPIESVPQDLFKPVEVEVFTASPSPSAVEIPETAPSNITVLPAEKKLTKKEQKIESVKKKRQKMLLLMDHSNKFTPGQMDDFADSAVFYIGAASKYKHVKPMVLHVIHKRESGASDPRSRAFKVGKNAVIVGGMQRNRLIWDQEFVNDSFKGLEYLNAFKERHKGDAKEIVAAAHMLERNIDKYLHKRWSYERALMKAMALYVGQGGRLVRTVGGRDEVNKRLDLIDKYERRIENQAKREKKQNEEEQKAAA